MPGAVEVGPVPLVDRFEVNIVLRRRPDGPEFPTAASVGRQSLRDRTYLTSEEFEERFGAGPGDMAVVATFLQQRGLPVLDVNQARRTIKVAGTAARFSAAFGVELRFYLLGSQVFRGPSNPLALPVELRDLVVAIIGLDERPVAIRPLSYHSGTWDPRAVAEAQHEANLATVRFQGVMSELSQTHAAALEQHPSVVELREHLRQARTNLPGAEPDAKQRLRSQMAISDSTRRVDAAVQDAYDEYARAAAEALAIATKQAALSGLDRLGVKTPPQVAELYDFPPDTDGTGECIAIIELGGGYDRATLDQYFAFLDLPVPEIIDVPVAGGGNRPGISEPVDGEVCLDIEVIGAAAPGAKVVCYFAPLTGLGFVEAIHAAVHDRQNRPSVISVSWDLSEGFWMSMPSLIDLMENVLAEAALLGITVVASAGDYGTPTTLHDGRAWVDYPASSPHVIGCGGTTLRSSNSSIVAETVWNTSATMGQTTGGGISQLFPVPTWQAGLEIPPSLNAWAPPGRGVPDVAANADPASGYLVQVTGVGTKVICGTSAAAPLWAALIARMNQSLGLRVGYIHPLIYALPANSGAFRDVVIGDNTFYYGYSGAWFPGYRAKSGWDPVTGWGTPVGTRLRDALASA